VATITFANIWYLYRPGTRVICFAPGCQCDSPRMIIVEGISGHEKKISRSGRTVFCPLKVTAWSITYTGNSFIRKKELIEIYSFDGAAPVESLTYVPSQFVRDRERILNTLLERGRKFWNLQGCHLREYNSGEENDTGNVSINTPYLKRPNRN